MKKDLIFLHGALGSASQLQELSNQFESSFNIHLPELPGHGATSAEVFTVEGFAAFIQTYIQRNNLSKPVVFGYSMGGYIALYLEQSLPGTFRQIITFGTKFNWSPEIANREVRMLQPEVIKAKVPLLAKTLESRHSNWIENLDNTAKLMKALGEKPLLATDNAGFNIPVSIMLGDRDRMVSLEETIQAYRAYPNSRLAVIPNTPHPIEQVNMLRLTAYITDMLNNT